MNKIQLGERRWILQKNSNVDAELSRSFVSLARALDLIVKSRIISYLTSSKSGQSRKHLQRGYTHFPPHPESSPIRAGRKSNRFLLVKSLQTLVFAHGREESRFSTVFRYSIESWARVAIFESPFHSLYRAVHPTLL